MKRTAVSTVHTISSFVFPCEYDTGGEVGVSRYLHTMYPSAKLRRDEYDPHDHECERELVSIQAAAAEAPTGSHQVLATKKYVLIRVISQIKASNARPIPQPPPGRHKRISPRRLSRFSHNFASNSRRRV